MKEFICETENSLEWIEIYNHLQDEESRQVYLARSLYSLSNERQYLKDVVRDMAVAKYMIQELEKHALQEYVLFGAGIWGDYITTFFPEIKWKCIVDNKRAGEKLNGYDIVSFDELREMNSVYIVIAIYFKYEEVEKQLLNAGFSLENILTLGRKVIKQQYFDLPALDFTESESFVDIGAFKGETSCRFIEVTKNHYGNIYLFEPNRMLYEECQKELADKKNCIVVNKGVSDKTETVYFEEDEAGSKISYEHTGKYKIETIKLDEFFREKEISYIKMDIEGEELAALRGAENIIRLHKPKLAISVYHTRTDIWEIPKLLLQYNRNYKFYLRVYSFTGNDTVLYAI